MPIQRDPMMLDSTGQAIVTKLESIKTAIENGGGGGGGSAPDYLLAEEFDPTTHNYSYGMYCKHEGSLYRYISSTPTYPASTFVDADWQETTLFDDLIIKPGFKTSSSYAEVFNDVTGNTASQMYAHAEGNGTTASGTAAHAEGYGTTASGTYAHAEGDTTHATAFRSHAEGYNTTAGSGCTHAEGFSTQATGPNSHSGGNGSVAAGNSAFAHGMGAKTATEAETAFGKYNVTNSGSPTNPILFSVGNGTSDSNRSNALTLYKDGTLKCKNIPDPPSTNGTYTLQCTVSGSSITYTWV